MDTSVHKSVLLDESLQYLQANKQGRYLDCTLGGGGHTRAILQANQNNIVYGTDRDVAAIERSKSMATDFPDRFVAKHASFSDVALVLAGEKFDGIIADLGISSDQLLSGRGFSFKDENSLDMRMNTTEGITAGELVNNFSLKDLLRVLRRGGVKQQAMKIAHAIIDGRPYASARQLADQINAVARMKNGKKTNPATVTFQAIRIEVNQELRQIEELLEQLPKLAAKNARVVILCFHSLEDKLVARQFRSWSRRDSTPALWAGEKKQNTPEPLGRIVTAKAVLPSDDEVELNPRARSARLRSFYFGEENGS